MNNKGAAGERHMVQLDGLRAIAIAAVIWSHWGQLYQFGIPMGTGVQLFFVLSGFLITGILLDNRNAEDRFLVWRRFYARRSLRIFPLFYATIAIALIVNAAPIRITWPWHVTYLSNFQFVRQGGWDTASNYYSRFWSLAVEEQFYLLWPILVLSLALKNIRIAIISLIVLAPVSRVLSTIFVKDDFMVHLLPWSNMDSLGIGSLFALLTRQSNENGLTAAKVGKFCLWVGLPVSLLGVAGKRLPYPIFTIAHTGLVLFYGWLVYKAAPGFKGFAGRVLSNEAFVYIGKVSYGLYVFLDFVPAITLFAASRFGYGQALKDSFGLRILVNSIVLLAMAALSWRFFEKPLNDLKRFFPYKSRTGRVAYATTSPSRQIKTEETI